jgi:hypothetical protein
MPFMIIHFVMASILIIVAHCDAVGSGIHAINRAMWNILFSMGISARQQRRDMPPSRAVTNFQLLLSTRTCFCKSFISAGQPLLSPPNMSQKCNETAIPTCKIGAIQSKRGTSFFTVAQMWLRCKHNCLGSCDSARQHPPNQIHSCHSVQILARNLQH